ncbi:MAG: hypothetical protein GX774_02500 [Armatimonadetes bacterium]|jgi:hypothetical protein|nr:hypothetical protein [Armatimonadota bacterium]
MSEWLLAKEQQSLRVRWAGQVQAVFHTVVAVVAMALVLAADLVLAATRHRWQS